jgi:hypothetical protein
LAVLEARHGLLNLQRGLLVDGAASDGRLSETGGNRRAISRGRRLSQIDQVGR